MTDASPPIMSGGSNTQLAADQTHGSAGDKLKDAVEMTSLEASRADDDAGPRTPAKDAPGTADEPPSLSAVARGKQKEAAAADGAEPAKDSLQIDRTDDEPVGPGSGPPADGPVCKITLLLPTGARHPYRIDAKYLEKRNVEIHDLTEDGKKDPFSISVYKLKELILREWRDEWENRPASPSSIRLIHFGKLLDDKEQLKKYQFSAESPNVVHMSVKPAEMMEEEEGAKSKTSGNHGGSGGSRGGCCVIL